MERIGVPNSVIFQEKAKKNRDRIMIYGGSTGLPAIMTLMTTMPAVAIPITLTGLAICLVELHQETRNLAKSEVHKEFELKSNLS